VLTTHPNLVSFISLCDSLPGTYHDAVSFSVTTVSPFFVSRFLLKYKDIDFDHFNSAFSRIPWNIIDHDDDIELSWSMWKVGEFLNMLVFNYPISMLHTKGSLL